jgi:hypothetical protein
MNKQSKDNQLRWWRIVKLVVGTGIAVVIVLEMLHDVLKYF